jgi:DNA polymerase II small subunit/DNA polymerase delta subunit B
MAIKCEKAGGLIDKKDTEKLSLKELIQLKLHVLNCSICKGYSDFSAKFKSLFKSLKNIEEKTLSPQEKTKLKKSLEN